MSPTLAQLLAHDAMNPFFPWFFRTSVSLCLRVRLKRNGAPRLAYWLDRGAGGNGRFDARCSIDLLTRGSTWPGYAQNLHAVGQGRGLDPQ